MKIKESQLRNIIKEAINEYRSSDDYDNWEGGNKGYDGDHWYVRPNGETPDMHDALMGDAGKRGKMNFTYNNDSTGKAETSTVPMANKYSHGKGDLCIQLQRSMDDIFFGNKKVVWTDAEKKMIEDIEMKISELATLTKKEGNKKRGYVRESQLRKMIRESLRHMLNEGLRSSGTGTIYGVSGYNPGESLEKYGIDVEGDKRLEDLLWHDYTIKFKAHAYHYPSDHTNPPEDGIEDVALYDDGGLSEAIKQLQNINPEIAKKLAEDFNEWSQEAKMDEAIIEWDWSTIGEDDYPEWGDDF